MSLKIVLSAVPNKYVFFRRFNIFKHGEMLNSEYAIHIYLNHYSKVSNKIKENYCVLELGPGDSVATALIAYAYGASTIYLVDVGKFASNNIWVYHKLIVDLARREDLKRDIKFLLDYQDIFELLKAIKANYWTKGISSLSNIPANSIDFIFSNAVLQHVNHDEVELLFKELHRIASYSALMSHIVNYNDHISYSLNSLRFSDSFWERKLIRNSGFYTNRIRHFEMIELIIDAGFEVIDNEIRRWENVPIKLKYINKKFKEREDLDICGATILCCKKINS